jgi:hypothetical protein
MRKLVLLGTLVAIVAGTNAASADWVAARGKACADVCAGQTSGTYRHPDARLNGQRFYICRADAGDGLRPGYNMKPNWSSSCWVAHGGQEKAINPYQCLCR